ncbi:MAG: FHA domain-containing protein [Polyangiaceae bacterium]|nr:FHA domain-containing protein [Polyangiaceae bacterium]
MARFRLRFLLQEFDLPQGETILGRSPECHVSIEDPLVSRQHARVTILGDDVAIEDLGSRNGVRVNGAPITGRHQLADGDRLRIGTQELVFSRVSSAAREASSKRTGFLRHCGQCNTPYPEELGACPSCGAVAPLDEETMSGIVGETKQSWTLQLLVEVLDKALSVGRDVDAERILRRATASVDERLDAGGAFDRRQIDALAEGAARLALMQRDARWCGWVLSTYARLAWVPRATFVAHAQGLPEAEGAALRPAVAGLIAVLRDRGGTMMDDDLAGMLKLEALGRELGA